MSYLDKINPFKNSKKIVFATRVGTIFFYTQFLIAIFLAYRELKLSCLILAGEVCPQTTDLIVFHYFKLIFLLPIIGLSLLFTLLEILSGLEFKLEQELLALFIFLAWLIFIVVSFYAPL